MKLATSPPPSPFTLANHGGALANKPRVYLALYCLIIAALWNTHSVLAAPAKLDLQPPIFEASAASQPTNGEKTDATATTIDSYGNPIESLQPIETPDGRKVVSAQGLQFEIPNYASGITEIKKPSDDLLPPFVDKFGSDISNDEVKTPVKAKNPFLPSPFSFDDGKYRPQNYAARPNTETTTRKTTTTTTTTPAPYVEKNPFKPTIPPYLLDFDYPDLGPGVPFVYDPNDDENPVDKNILPPSQAIIESSSKPDSDSVRFSPNSPFANSQTPQGFTNKFTTSAISLASSSSIPSIVTVPLPSTQTNQVQDVLISTATQPPVVFVPPSPTAAEGITTTFNKNFAASFEPTSTSTASSSSPSTAIIEKKDALSADRESFPPFNSILTGSSSTTLPSKTTFTKSEDGKVITNNLFLSGGLGSTSVKPFAFSVSAGNSQEKNTLAGSNQSSTKTTTAASTVFGTTSSLATGFTANAGDATNTFGSKYTGRFGGPPGVLAPQNNNVGGFSTTAATTTTVTKTFNKPAVTSQTLTTSTGLASGSAAAANHKFTGSFGGPPGVLKPYDNVKSG